MLALEYLPYNRTSHTLIGPSSLAASNVGTGTGESFNEGKVNTKQDEEMSYSTIYTGNFPHYRTHEELGQPLPHGLNGEGGKPDKDGKDESKGEVETVSWSNCYILPETAQPGNASSATSGSTHPTSLGAACLPQGFAGLSTGTSVVAEPDAEMCVA